MVSPAENMFRFLGGIGGGNNAMTRLADSMTDPLRAEELRLRREERARQIEQQKRTQELLQNPQILGRLATQFNLPPEIFSGVQSFDELNNLGSLSSLLNPTPQLPQGVDLPEGYEPIFTNGQFSGVKPITGINQPTSMPKEIPSYLPKLSQDPLTNFQDKEKAQLEFLKQSEDQIKTEEEQSVQESFVADRLKRFLELQDVQDTGVSQIPTPFVGYRDPELREMAAIQSEVAPKMRQVGSGSSSDKDVEMFKEATVSPTKPPQTNKNIAAARIAAAENKVARVDFLREYQAAYGHTKGADAEWKKYLEANPIFAPSADKETFTLNEGRQDWRDYFSNAKPTVANNKKSVRRYNPATGKIE